VTDVLAHVSIHAKEHVMDLVEGHVILRVKEHVKDLVKQAVEINVNIKY
jgi:hypothetical protein